jgi:hypothetical protein
MLPTGGKASKEDPIDKHELFLKSNAHTEKLEFTWDVPKFRSAINHPSENPYLENSWCLEFESGKTVQ